MTTICRANLSANKQGRQTICQQTVFATLLTRKHHQTGPLQVQLPAEPPALNRHAAEALLTLLLNARRPRPNAGRSEEP